MQCIIEFSSTKLTFTQREREMFGTLFLTLAYNHFFIESNSLSDNEFKNGLICNMWVTIPILLKLESMTSYVKFKRIIQHFPFFIQF